jgi:hypothetical protein
LVEAFNEAQKGVRRVSHQGLRIAGARAESSQRSKVKRQKAKVKSQEAKPQTGDGASFFLSADEGRFHGLGRTGRVSYEGCVRRFLPQ